MVCSGALSAAVNNLSSLLGVVSPIAWAWVYSFFDKGNPSAKALAAGAKQNHWLFRWGKGGHLFIAAGVLLLALGVLHTSPKSVMFLDDADEKKDKDAPTPTKGEDGFQKPVPAAE